MNSDFKNNAVRLAKPLFDYLYLQDKISLAEAIIGFGHFDQKIPFHCGKLFCEGFAPLIIFSGGIGAGSAGLKKPEALEFFDTLKHHFPDIPSGKVFLEDKSTNTGENIKLTLDMLRDKNPEFSSFRKLIIAANSYRQRRVWLTCKKYFKNTELINSPPDTNFEEELEMFERIGEDLCSHLIQELVRIRTYPDNGYIEKNVIPKEIDMIAVELYKLMKI